MEFQKENQSRSFVEGYPELIKFRTFKQTFGDPLNIYFMKIFRLIAVKNHLILVDAEDFLRYFISNFLILVSPCPVFLPREMNCAGRFLRGRKANLMGSEPLRYLLLKSCPMQAAFFPTSSTK
jgi:hypothetical protein